jgi:hypothetical protein
MRPEQKRCAPDKKDAPRRQNGALILSFSRIIDLGGLSGVLL